MYLYHHTAWDRMLHRPIFLIIKACDRVSRSLLSDVCQQRLKAEHIKITALLLQPVSVRTKKDMTNSCATITIGVPQGESFICTLFNIFQDTLHEKLSSVPHHISEKAASALADDVIIMSETAEGFQLLLDNCTEWSGEYQMLEHYPGKVRSAPPTPWSSDVYILPIWRTTAKCGIVCIPWRIINHIRNN